jgi:hypothetical protein
MFALLEKSKMYKLIVAKTGTKNSPTGKII